MRCVCQRGDVERELGVCRYCFADRRQGKASSPQMTMVALGDRRVKKRIQLGIPYEILIQN